MKACPQCQLRYPQEAVYCFLDGAELTRIIRTPGVLAGSAVPIIMFSASAPSGRVAEAKQLGVDAYLTMPISAKALLDRIISVLTKSRGADASGAVAEGEARGSLMTL